MGRMLTAREICERALRAVEAFPLSESAPDGEMLREALSWLDIIMGEVGGTNRLFHLTTTSLPVVLQGGVQNYALRSSMGANFPIDGMQFPVHAFIIEPGGQPMPLDIVSLETWRTYANDGQKGIPHTVYVDRQPSPVLRTFPTLPNDLTGYTLRLDVQRYTPTVAPGGVTGNAPNGSVVHGFREAWQRYLILRLSHDLGMGPIGKIGEASLNRFERHYKESLILLKRFDNQEHDDEPPVAKAYDFDLGWKRPGHGGGDSYVPQAEAPVSGEAGEFIID